MNLFVTIKGLAMYRLGDDNQWKIFFPEAPDHPFKLIVIKRRGTHVLGVNEFVIPIATEIDFFPDSGNNAGSAGATLSELESAISIKNLHQRYHQEEIVLKEKKELYAGFLNLNGTVLESQKATDQFTFDVWDVIGGTKTKVDEVKVGSTLEATFAVDSDQTRIIVKNNDALNFELNLSYGNGEFYDVIFSNDCEVIQVGSMELTGKGCRDISDFKYYYRIIDTQRLKGRFELIMEDEDEKRSNGACSPTGG
jgi:hypothetical protein